MKKTLLLVILALVLFVIFLNFNYINMDAAEERKTIIIPVKIHLIKSLNDDYTTTRNDENIVELFGEANRIWKQGKIYFSIEEITETEMDSEGISNALKNNYQSLTLNKNFDDQKINVFFIKTLNNINGLALIGSNSVFVADFTTVNDFRTLSHEFGHILGLKHIQPNTMLMAQGRNGEILNNNEIYTSRKNAEKLF